MTDGTQPDLYMRNLATEFPSNTGQTVAHAQQGQKLDAQLLRGEDTRH